LTDVIKIGNGEIHCGDALDVLPTLPVVSTIFADPPFNLDKNYGPGINDKRGDYEEWTRQWLKLAVDRLEDGGSFWYFNIPRWGFVFADEMGRAGLRFNHWVAISLTTGSSKEGFLSPAHYSLIHFSKGDFPKAVEPLRYPIPQCRHCGGDVKDYGGHRDKIDARGLRFSDVWTDLSPIRHSNRKWRQANQMPEAIVRRALHVSPPGGLVLDPFLGSGTTAAVAQKEGYPWVGIELGPTKAAVQRLTCVLDGWQEEGPPSGLGGPSL
jgi:site-specific DNA-methyltransferase (adenine-specific)